MGASREKNGPLFKKCPSGFLIPVRPWAQGCCVESSGIRISATVIQTTIAHYPLCACVCVIVLCMCASVCMCAHSVSLYVSLLTCTYCFCVCAHLCVCAYVCMCVCTVSVGVCTVSVCMCAMRICACVCTLNVGMWVTLRRLPMDPMENIADPTKASASQPHYFSTNLSDFRDFLWP